MASHKYEDIYNHYRKLIEEGALKKGDKLPSLIATSKELQVSKTTTENAYFQLAADGYVISKEKSGYYVTGRTNKPRQIPSNPTIKKETNDIRYDLSTIGDDPSFFRFDLWQRYIKTAIRHTDRMATFGEPQGESELREVICEFIRKRRNIYCSPDSIVIGASTQTLLSIILPILKANGTTTASVPARGFDRFERIFEAYNYDVDIRRKESDIIYVSPSYMTVWGEVMSLNRRYEIIEHSKNGHLIIEDDYQNEFNFAKQITPSLYSLANGENVIYIGSFSRLLLPSIRISFMILPTNLQSQYKEISRLYDQTASKTEQLALSSYIRDGHLLRHIRKLRKTYSTKLNLLRKYLELVSSDNTNITLLSGDSGTEIALMGDSDSISQIKARLEKNQISFQVLSDTKLLFSCSLISISDLKKLVSDLSS